MQAGNWQIPIKMQCAKPDVRRKWLLKKWTGTKNPSHKKITSSPDSFTNKFYQLKEKKKVSILLNSYTEQKKMQQFSVFFVCGLARPCSKLWKGIVRKLQANSIDIHR